MKSEFNGLFVSLGKLAVELGGYIVRFNGRREFHVCRECRDRYGFDDSLFSKSGNVIFANFQKAREFAAKLNARRSDDTAIKAGDINAMGLMDEILHHVVHIYLETVDSQAFEGAVDECRLKMGSEVVDEIFLEFTRDFPPEDVYRGAIAIEDYLSNEANHGEVVEELMMVWLANMNPAYRKARELFDDENLKKNPFYQIMIGHLVHYFASRSPIGPERENLIELLRRPALESPYSLSGQLNYIRRAWGLYLQPFLARMLQSEDLIKEEEKVFFEGPGGISLEDWRERLRVEEFDSERFTPDTDWMPNLVLIAKSIYVWLDQLSKTYQRPITRLDHIPDEELDLLADRGFTGLWLIGIWRRSQASAEIKQRCGNPEAMSSAYSIYSYEIAPDLGGDAALDNLKQRALTRGIRLGADMVPNHMGVDSPIVHHHPEWFIHRRECPFPSYTFNGPDLSSHPEVEIKIEDHYYDRSDAAVVFKWRHKHSGEVYYIYHGNDGTGLPWNDTAQFNYLLPQVREAVMGMILKVAGQFPIVRFDAAMTLTQKHFRRLWFPQPGEGGDIPSRSEEGLRGEDFTRAMPREFWREVVDRAANEAPDTLLLAEAFWLMESYFVRTLGMHRVYNSAFMNLLKNEDNGEYRTYTKNIMEFNPEILRRYVNFMNNPDEETAVAQFGKDDKYFGVCTLMATLPGLPMFGHGQVEGFQEKYGMEYRRAYLDEEPDQHLIERHRNEIFPLLHQRWLFAGVEHFRLYDFITMDGSIDENIFAFTNRVGEDRCLVIAHNRFADTRGWIKRSVSSAPPQTTLGRSLGLNPGSANFVLFTDQVSGLHYIRSVDELDSKGLFIELGAFKRHVFIDFVEVQDNQWRHYAQLHDALAGRGVSGIDEALQEMVLAPLHSVASDILHPQFIDSLTGSLKEKSSGEVRFPDEVFAEISRFYETAASFSTGTGEFQAILHKMKNDWERIVSNVSPIIGGESETIILLVIWWMLRRIGELVSPGDTGEAAGLLLDQWQLDKHITKALFLAGFGASKCVEAATLLKVLLKRHGILLEFCRGVQTMREVVERLFQDVDVKLYLRINQYRGVIWFHKDSFEALFDWLYILALAEDSDFSEKLANATTTFKRLASEAKYQADQFIASVSS